MGSIAAVHAVDSFKDRIAVPSIRYLEDRSLLREDVGILFAEAGERREEIESYYHEYLQPLGFGPDRLQLVSMRLGVSREVAEHYERYINSPHGIEPVNVREEGRREKDEGVFQDFFTALQHDSEAMAAIRGHMAHKGATIEAFSASSDFERFYMSAFDARDEGIPFQSSRTAPQRVASRLDHKVQARELARELGAGVEGGYVSFDLCWDEDDIRDSVRYMLREHGSLILRASNVSNGLGMLRVKNAKDKRITKFVEKFMKSEHGIVAEVDVGDHVSGYLQWEIDRSGEARPLFMTVQPNRKKGAEFQTVHDGDDIGAEFNGAFPGHWPGDVRYYVEQKAWDASKPELAWAIKNGYVGRLGMTFLVSFTHGQRLPTVYKSAFSARMTAASYGYGVMQQASDRCKDASVVIRNCIPSVDLSGWRQANALLKQGRDLSMNPDTGSGVLLGLTRRLPERCMLVACSSDLRQSRRMMRDALSRFGHRS
jgi:hypothetical protein